MARNKDQKTTADSDRPEELDDEDLSGDVRIGIKPWDPGKIRITTKALSLRDVVNQIGDKDIDLAPDFQRDFVWKKRQRTRLVESVLLGIPLPAFYFNQQDDGTYQVVDGVQRLSTIALFMNDHHILDQHDLEYLDSLHGMTFSNLDLAAQRRFRGAQIVVHVIEPQTPAEMKYDIFSRVNTLGSPLSAQEIRHATSRSRSRTFLKSLAESDEFDIATELQFWRRDPEGSSNDIRDSARMTNRELALRFCAFSNYSEEEYKKHSSLDSFLVDFTRRLDGIPDDRPPISDKGLEDLKKSFLLAMKNAGEILESAAFRRWPKAQSRRGPINRAVFESQAIALSKYPTKKLLTRQSEIVDAFRNAFSEPDYVRSVTVGTGAPKSVTFRLERTQEILSGIIK